MPNGGPRRRRNVSEKFSDRRIDGGHARAAASQRLFPVCIFCGRRWINRLLSKLRGDSAAQLK
jgi:hypothetical protein